MHRVTRAQFAEEKAKEITREKNKKLQFEPTLNKIIIHELIIIAQ
jgi:hypothetical protein